MLHPLPSSCADIPSPKQFTYPFHYTPHPLCLAAADAVRTYLHTQPHLLADAKRGKMLGVLVVGVPQADGSEGRGFLAAFSGELSGSNRQPYFVPPIYDLLHPEGRFQREERAVVALTRAIHTMHHLPQFRDAATALHHCEEQAAQEVAAAKAYLKQAKSRRDQLRHSPASTVSSQEAQFVAESRHLKAEFRRLRQRHAQRIAASAARVRAFTTAAEALIRERARRSAALQHWLFNQYHLHNALGEVAVLPTLFEGLPPSGSGECCAPKLLQAAFLAGFHPLCMAEFWMGVSPRDEVRCEGNFYPSCRHKCRPLLRHMLRGLDVEPNPLLERNRAMAAQLRILYVDQDFVVVSKPSGMLSVPGNDDVPSVRDEMRRRFPQAEGPMMVHRLDMDTSGLMVVALTAEAYRRLQVQFARHTIEKCYVALLDSPAGDAHSLPFPPEGTICLPLCANPDDRPRQMVSQRYGLPAETHYQVVGRRPGLRLHLHPTTGRTHQLRLHCAHPDGLGVPIVGDALYGRPDTRLCLHAESLAFTHPTTGERLTFHDAAPF